MNATKNGIANCPNCKAIDEAVLEGAFVDAFKLLAGNFDDVLDVVLSYVEESANSNQSAHQLFSFINGGDILDMLGIKSIPVN
jgi:hypothetical protein